MGKSNISTYSIGLFWVLNEITDGKYLESVVGGILSPQNMCSMYNSWNLGMCLYLKLLSLLSNQTEIILDYGGSSIQWLISLKDEERTQRHKESHVKREAEIGGCVYNSRNVRNFWEPPGVRKTRGSTETSERTWHPHSLVSECWPPGFGKTLLSLVLGHLVVICYGSHR